MFHKMTEERELQLERDRAKAKAALRTMRRVCAVLGIALALSFAYAAGEMQGVMTACGIGREVTSDP